MSGAAVGPFGRALGALARRVLARPRASAVVLVVVALAVIVGAVHLRLDFSSRSFFGASDSSGRDLDGLHARWGVDDDVLVVVARAGERAAEPDLRRAAAIDQLDAVAAALRGAPGVVRVRAPGDVVTPVWPAALEPEPTQPPAQPATPGIADEPYDPSRSDLELAWRTLAQHAPRGDPPLRAAAQQFIERVRDDPALTPVHFARDGRTAAIVVEIASSSDDVGAIVPTIAGIERALAPFAAAGELTFELAGIPPIRAAFFIRTIADQATFVPLALALIGVCLFAVFRSLQGVLVPAIAAALPTVMTLGVMGWTGEPIGLLNQAYFTLLPVIAVADGIHLLARYLEERAADGRRDPARAATPAARDAAIVRAVESVGLACAMTSLTTAIGFASLAVADMPILRRFGLYAAVGIGLAFVTVVVVVPLLLRVSAWERRAPAGPPAGAAQLQAADGDAPMLAAIAGWSARRPALVLAASAALLVGAVAAIGALRVDNRLTGLLSAEHPTSLASRHVDAELAGILTLEVELRGDPNTLLATSTLRAVADHARWAESLGEVGGVADPARPLLGLWTALEGDDDRVLYGDAARGPRTPAQALELLDRLGDGIDLAERWTPARDGARLTIAVQDAGGVRFEALAELVALDLRWRLTEAGVTDVELLTTSTAYVAYRGVNRITGDLWSSLLVAFVVIAGVITVLLRSVTLGLLSMVPNVMPLLCGAALLWGLGWELDPLAAVVLTLALGIAVDDTIHLLARIDAEQRAALATGSGGGSPVQAAISRAVQTTGRAVAITSFALAGGLAINALSSFPALRILGVLGAAVMLIALACDLVVLPALWVVARGRAEAHRPTGRSRRRPTGR